MKNLFLLSFVLMSSLAFSQQAQFPSDLDNDSNQKALVKNMIDDTTAGKYKAEDVALELVNLADSLYSNGVSKLETFNLLSCKVKELINIDKVMEAMSPANRYICGKNFFVKFQESSCNDSLTFDDYFPLTGAPVNVFQLKYQCAGKLETPGSIVHNPYNGDGAKQFSYMMYLSYVKKLVNEVKNNRESLVPEYALATTKQCQSGLLRLPFARFEATNSCEMSGKSCSKHEDCCSSHCLKTDDLSSGICSQEVACYRLLSDGESCGELPNNKYNPYCDNKQIRHAINPTSNPAPAPGEKVTTCTETNFNTSEIGECTNVGATPTGNKPCCSDKIGAGGKCVDNFTCDICYKDGEVPENNKGCCPGYYKSLSGKCIQDFPPLVPTTKVKKNIFQNILNIILPSAHAQDQDSSSLTSEERAAFDERRTQCLTSYPGDDDSEDRSTCLSNVSKEESALISQRLNDPNSNPNLMSRAEYKKKFNRAVIIEKKSSDFEKCEFHSFNDNWNSGSDTYRNAEIVLRGFEYLYSGKGTVDYWIDDRGKSIYERAQAIALQLRQNRRLLIDRYREIDEQMTAECKEYFTQAKWKDENGADTSSGDKREKNEDIDKGASGIKHTQMMVKFLRLRSEAQMQHFTNNSQGEAQMTELSDYISGNQWEQSWSQEVKLYDFTVKKPRGWLVVVLIIIAVAAIVALTFFTAGLGTLAVAAIATAGGLSVVGVLVATIGPSVKMGLENYTAEVVAKSMYQDTPREIKDIKGPWEGSGLFKKKQRIKRWYLGPYFRTGDSRSLMSSGVNGLGGNPQCETRSSSRLCVKNVHMTSYDEQLRFLLDVKTPVFLSDNVYEKDSGLLKMIRDGHSRGMQKLIATNPGTTRQKFLERDLLAEGDIAISFLPKFGKWLPKLTVQQMKDKVIEAAAKYAKCEKLSECGASNASDGDYGFGLLISNDEDAREFGDYFYQHHFLWPSLSSSGTIGYPSMAQASYFETVSYYLKIVGSLAASKSLDFGNLADKYQSHLDDLEGEYDQGSGAYQGRGSSNVAYSSEFRAKFGLLDFNTGAGADQFVGEGGIPKIPKGFSSAESTAFAAGVNKALRAKKQKEKADHYEKTVGQTKRGKLKKSAQGSFMQSFGKPVDRMSASLRQGLDSSSTSAAQGEGAKGNKESSATTASSLTPPNFASYQQPQIPSYNSSSYSRSNQSSSGQNSASGQASTGTGQSDAAKNKMLLDSADKISRELKRDDSDSLFKIVTKAYFRNLDLILERTTSAKAKVDSKKVLEFKAKEDEISNDKKNELKKLLNE